MEFSKITYQPLNGPLAQVDRKTLELFIDSEKWEILSKLQHGELYKDYILLHEKGHITLQTADEYRANRFAINKFMRKIAEMTNDELGARVIVLSDLLENDPDIILTDTDKSNIAPIIVAGIISAISAIFGSASANNAAKKASNTAIQIQTMQGKVEEKKIKGYREIAIISGLILFLIVVTWVAFKK